MPTTLLPATENTTTTVIWRWLIWGGCVSAWTLALLTPQPVQVAQEVLPPPSEFPTAKILHVCMYAFLTILSAWLGVRGPRRWLLVVFLSLHGCLTEYFQTFVPLRTGSWIDVGIDHLGILLGLLLSWKWWRNGANPTPPAG
jgi:VanZ family protein